MGWSSGGGWWWGRVCTTHVGVWQPDWVRHGVACHFLGALLLNIKRNQWRLHGGRQACGIEELLRSV